MNIETIIAQIKANVPELGGRVSGAANFATGLESAVNMLLPAAYVLRLADDPAPNDQQPGLQQVVTEHVGVVVEFDNTLNGDADRRTGFSGVNQVDDMRAALFRGMLNYLPEDIVARQGFSYSGAHLIDFDRARLFWQYDFEIDNVISDADGVGLYGDPLTNIHAEITVEPGAPLIEIDLPVPIP